MRWRNALRVMVALVAAVTLVLNGPVAFGQASESTEPLSAEGVEEVGRIPYEVNHVFGLSGGMVLDSKTRNGFLFEREASTTHVVRFDLDTLKRTGSVESPVQFLQDSATDNSLLEPPRAVGGGKLFVVSRDKMSVLVFDQTTLEFVDELPGPTAPLSTSWLLTSAGSATEREATGAASGVTALAYRPPADDLDRPKLLALTGGFRDAAGSDLPQTVALAQYDIETGEEEWVARLDACRRRPGSGISKYGYGLGLSRARDGSPEAVVGCIGSGGEVWRVGLAPDGSGIRDQTFVASVPFGVDFHVDSAGRRVVVQTDGPRQSLVAVDLDRLGVVGLVLASFSFSGRVGGASTVSAGLDPTSGRLYALTSSSEEGGSSGRNRDSRLLLVDARRNPLPQELAFPSLNPEDRGGSLHLAVDPAVEDRPRRVFVRYGVRDEDGQDEGDGEDGPEPFVRVFEDRVPVEEDVALGAVDSLTDDVPEEPGSTRAGFTTGATAYGTRGIYVGGVAAASPKLGPGSLFRGAVFGSLAPSACWHKNRQITLAAVLPGTGLSDTGATGRATPADADSATRQDAATPASSCEFQQVTSSEETVNFLIDLANETAPHDVPEIPKRREAMAGPNEEIDDTAGRTWGFSEAVCSRGETDAAPHEDDSFGDGVPPPPGFTSEVECAEDGSSLVAMSEASATEAGPLSVASSETRTVIERLEGGGVEVTTDAVVRGLRFEGVFEVDRIKSRAVSRAAGRTGTADTEFHRRWCGVRGAGEDASGACLNPDSEDGQAFVEGINQLLGLQDYRIVVPTTDPDLAEGTPKGVLAAVQKDRFTAVGDQLLNNDGSTAVPAMQIEHYHDTRDRGRGRQIYQFAGVEASTAYWVNRILQGEFSSPSDPSEEPSGSAPAPVSSPPSEPIESTVASGQIEPEVIRETITLTGAESGGEAAPELAAPPADAGTPLPEAIYAIGRGLHWLLRNPLEALKVGMLLFAAFALPLHLYERRRTLRALLSEDRPSMSTEGN